MFLLRTLALLLLIINGSLVSAQETEETEAETLAGHSYHGEFLNDGPRQSAYLMGGTGVVDFEVTTAHAEVPAFINQGIGQVYGFWYLEAERSFRHAAALDSDCAIAWWGAALAALENDKRAKGFIAEAVKRKDKASDREKMYIDALDTYLKADKAKSDDRDAEYRKRLEDIALKYPQDLDAKALLAMQLYKNRKNGNYLAANALMEQIFEIEPLHSVHHFRIHLWDAKKAENALTSAARCGQGSPAIAHMWHMPGHIYSRLNRYEDACWQQEASARVDHAHMMRDRVLPDQIHNYAHNNEWLIRNLNHVGRVRDAVDLSKNMLALPRHPRYNTLKKGSTRYGRTRLLETLELYELWEEAQSLCDSAWLEPTDDLREQIKRARLLGIASAETGQPQQANAQLKFLTESLKTQTAERDKTEHEAEKKAIRDQLKKQQSEKPEAESTEPADKEVADSTDTDKTVADKKETNEISDTDRTAILKEHKKEIDAAKKKATVSLNSTIKALEQAIAGIEGHLLLAQNEFKPAFDKLKQDKGTDAMLLAKVQLQTGETDKALESARKHVSKNKQEVQPQAALVELLWLAEQQDEARKEFETLRQMSGSIDLASPVFTRLAPIAAELKVPSDWRISSVPRDDVGVRPALDSLGPLHWAPKPAPDWQLANADGKVRSLEEFRGKPVVVIFYLGYACLHCAEQLQAFAPQVEQFQKSGIEVIAISTDDNAGLTQSIKNYGEEPLPIPLVSNSELDVFKQWRVYDDFEKQPLHGTFLLDAEGKILWQDISYEPFLKPDFLLEESQRLLEQQQSTESVPVGAPSESVGLKSSLQ